MLVEDSAAFVERLEVPADGTDKLRRDVARAELDALTARWEVHLAESAVLELTRLVREEVISGRARSLQRDLRAMRKHLRGTQEALAAGVARVDRLQAELHAYAARHQPYVAFRLHSAGHHVDCSERRFGRLATSQLQRPVFVLKRERRAWWWYLNRSWWVNGSVRRSKVAEAVLRRDLQQMLAADALTRARVAILGETEGEDALPVPDALHLSVWSRHRGRCVDCGSDERVNFDKILATSERRTATPLNFELRCQTCRDRRTHNEGRARISRAQADVTYERIY
jgi:hypothetical protein